MVAVAVRRKICRYFIPSDGDDPAHPNVFQLPSGLVSSGEVRCADVKRHFPLPGRYHFRFKKKFKNAFGELLQEEVRTERPPY